MYKAIKSNGDISKVLHQGKVIWCDKIKVIVIGDADGCKDNDIVKSINSGSFATVLKSYLWEFASGFYTTEIMKNLIDQSVEYFGDNFILVIGTRVVQPSVDLATEAKRKNIKTYHITEPEIKNKCDPKVYDDLLGMMEMVIEVEEIHKVLKAMRDA